MVGEEGRKHRLGAVLARVARRGGRVGGGGASESIGGAKQWLWPRRQQTAAAGGFGGCVREREQRRGDELEGVSERDQGAAWRRGRGPGRRGEGGKQEVAGASPALATELLRGEGRKTTGGGGLGRAGPVLLGHQVGCEVSAR